MISGIINLKKEAGMTSHDAVFKLRKILNEKKIGHGGTLDPDVTGVLPIAVGKSTRIIEYMTEAGKVYEGEITIGFSTTTEDASGEVVNVTVVSDLTEEAVDAAMSRFVGQITQVPPMYSAVKVNGRRLYEYARQGEVVERPSRRVTITEFSRTSPIVLNNNCAMFSFRVVCSKGTYVRTLSVDLGTALGYASHMSALQRTASAGLELSSALTLEQIKEKVNAGDWGFLLPIEYGVSDLPRVELTEEAVTAISYGRRVALDAITPLVAGFHDGKVIAILEARDNLYKPRKVLI
ncbi:tRNA pseudouridine(55) synthase TruB [Streptococcus sp. S784/96/1]|uniref:tRNA pseudouridine(55) synthase TruB n=1 Tax=Streptococcus sp. S784/96/1 TaxID=2653499 RepID=UPI001389EC26|nr:tRNA pseudouridine(55) synthase TruB [Streptococcus sp. S784/96/1]